MTLHQTITAAVAALGLGLGAASYAKADEPKPKNHSPFYFVVGKPVEKPKENPPAFEAKPLKPLSCEDKVKKHWDKYSGICTYLEDKWVTRVCIGMTYGAVTVLYENIGLPGEKATSFWMRNSRTAPQLEGVTFFPDCDHLNCDGENAKITNLEDPEVYAAAGTKFCEYFSKAIIKIEKDRLLKEKLQKTEEEERKQKQLDLLK